MEKVAAEAAVAAARAAVEAVAKVAPPTVAPAAAPAVTTINANGTVNVTWLMTEALKPWPADCDGHRDSYQVQVRDGAGNLTYLAKLASARVTERGVQDGIYAIRCEMKYMVQPPSAAIYTFTLISRGSPAEALDQQQIGIFDIRAKGAPVLSEVTCFEC